MRVIDAVGRVVEVTRRPKRIVSMVPSQTELLAALGLDAEVVGITRYCVRPEDWRTTRGLVGGTKKARLERIEVLAPDLILANKEENTREDVERLTALAPVYVTDVADLDGALEMILAVGELVGRRENAEALREAIWEGFEALPRWPRLRAAYLIWRNPWMAVGSGTFIHDMMDRAGLDNVLGATARYPQVTLEELAEARPEVVLLSSEPYPFASEHIQELEEALPDAITVLVDGEPFSWYGSRLLHSPEAFRTLRMELSEHVAVTPRDATPRET